MKKIEMKQTNKTESSRISDIASVFQTTLEI